MRIWFGVGVTLLPLGLGLACGSSDVASPFTPSFPKGSGGKFASSGGEGGAPAVSGGSTAEGGVAGQAELGGAAGSPNPQSGGAPATSCQSKPPQGSQSYACGPKFTFGESAEAAMDTGAAAILTITPDQRVLLGKGQSPLGDFFFVLERTDPSDEFAPRTDLDTDDEPVSLSPDGLRLIVVSSDRTTLAEIPRGAIGEPFAADAAPFAAINARLDDLGHPLISVIFTQDDLGLVYTTYDPEEKGSRLHWATRATTLEPFSAGEPLQGCELEGTAYQAVLPTSFASDALALFLYDEILGRARVAFRKSLSSDFKGFVDLDKDARVFVNDTCGSAFLGAPLGNAPIRVALLESGP